MAIDKAQQAFQDYVDTASDLAESVKRNIVHEGVIDDETVLKLNAFIIASNAMADLPMNLSEDDNESDENLN
jgi:hypothetical protein